jgi:pectate lyase
MSEIVPVARALALLAGVLIMTSQCPVPDASPAQTPRLAPIARTPADDVRLAAVRAFADNVLTYGRDHYGGISSPLFVDGVNVDTREPVVWRFQGKQWIVSDLANQQILFRTFVGLSNLTGDPRYRQAAEDATRYAFEHLCRSCGLLQWGGHRYIDLNTHAPVGESDTHELKSVYPYYDLMWEVDPQATERYIKAFWNAHVLDWSTLDMNRHGGYERPLGALWAHEFRGAPPFFEGRGLTFINCGSDVVYAGAELCRLNGDTGALTWAKRLAQQYVKARDPRTHLGAYQFSQPKREREPVDDDNTSSAFGDRAHRQFGPEFGDRALEGKMLMPGQGSEIYGSATIVQLRLAEALGDAGREFLEWPHSGLRAYAKYAYDPKTNMLTAMFTDGTRLTPDDVRRPGYYSRESFRERPAGSMLLLSYALGYRLTCDLELWRTVRAMARGCGLGEVGPRPGVRAELNLKTESSDPVALFAALEIWRTARDPAYIALARRIGDNIVARRFHHGFFLPDEDRVNARFDALEPLALLSLEAILRGTPDAVPQYSGGSGYIHGPHDGLGRTYDSIAIWSKKRDAPSPPQPK